MDGKSKVSGDSSPACPDEESHGVLLWMKFQPPADVVLGRSLEKPAREKADRSSLGKAKPVAEKLVVNE